MRFGVLPDFGKTHSEHTFWASKLTEFLDICNTILCPSLGPYIFSCLLASRDIIPFLIWLDFAFSFRIPSVDTFFPFDFLISRLRTCALSFYFFFGPRTLSRLTFFSLIRLDTTVPLKKCLFFSFVYRRFGIDGTEYLNGLIPKPRASRPHGQ
jgi:hypothetical protein